jgi:integrase
MLDVYVLPKIGKRKAAQVTKREIIFVIEEVAQRGPTQANRVLAVTRKMFNFAVEKDILSFSPCYGVKQVAKEKAKDRNLSAAEIKTFWGKLETAKMSEPIRCALRLILITAQRPGEVLSIEAKEIDASWWTISGEKAKNATPHRVPLSSIAVATLPGADSGHLFTSPRGEGKHIHVNALAHAIRRNKEHFDIDHFTPHDLRRTAATQMRQLGVDRFTVSRILNHVDREITATYDRYSHDKEKRQALEKWGRKLERVTACGEAVKIIQLSAR